MIRALLLALDIACLDDPDPNEPFPDIPGFPPIPDPYPPVEPRAVNGLQITYNPDRNPGDHAWPHARHGCRLQT